MKSIPTDMQHFTGENTVAKFLQAREAMGKRSAPHVRWLNEHADDTKIRFPKKGWTEGIPTTAAVLNDYESGIVCVAGKQNAGKSTYVVNLQKQGLDNDDALIVADISLDDPPKKRLTQYVAAETGLFYQDIMGDTKLHPNQVELRENAFDKIIQYAKDERLWLFEGTEVVPGTQRRVSVRDFRSVIYLMEWLRERFPDNKIAVFADSWNQLDYTPAKGISSDLNQANFMLQDLKLASEQNGIMLIVTAHLRKSLEKRPTMDDIKGTSNMAYDCVAGLILRNEYRENAMVDPLMYEDEEAGLAYPMLTIEVQKTKVGIWDFPLFYGLKQAQAQIVPLEEHRYIDTLERYRSRRK